MKLSTNFNLNEFESKDGAKTPENVLSNLKELVKNLQIIRDNAGAIKINSGYRSPAHNKAEGGVANSQHIYGKASDLKPLKITPKQLYNLIIELIGKGLIYNGGVGIYDTFVHYDIGGKGRRWDYRKNKK
ncbi:DUF882 domain-containing protein [Empedobacter sp. 225-1]|uniref:YcbK family protein n=1 Tax=Empedobacter sp. 225-1 TaxID=2746725 RepID=UPI002578DCD8|nr:D-Ala-D-Ala carboxypeptidase family metallohydrolase [Empedobacter sp. 225-1]MDM1523851.1 DUF882 domain-containing protein [Empedobacter sp. 225-1]